jgi:antitoxin PrlF
MGKSAQSKLSSKSQTVIPKSIRDRLGLQPGDTVRFRVTNEQVTIEKVIEGDDDPFATFSEWNSEEDERLYRDL